MAAATGEPLRAVNFVPPSYYLQIRRLMPVYKDFDPTKEVLHCEKPGTGRNDAPRCVSLRLAMATRNMRNMKPSTVDPELLHAP